MSKSREEAIAMRLYDALSDIRTDPYLVGRYLAQQSRAEVWDKFELVVESARDEKQHRIEWLQRIITGDRCEEDDDDF